MVVVARLCRRRDAGSSSRADGGKHRPWFRPWVEIDGNLVDTLIARARRAGATVTAQQRDGDPWRPVPDPVEMLRQGTQVDRVDRTRPRPAIDGAVSCELTGLLPYAWYILECIDWTADRLAEDIGLERDVIHRPLGEEFRLALATIAQWAREALRPPDLAGSERA